MTVLQEKLLPTLDYLLREWLDLGSLLERPRFGDHDLDGIGDLLEAASAVAAELYEPANRVSDDHEPVFDDGRVILDALMRPRPPKLGDASSPEHLRATLGLSKKAFKRALGRLLKEGAVVLDGDGFVALPPG